MPPFAPRAISVNPANMNFAGLLNPLTGAGLARLVPSSTKVTVPDHVIPVPPAAPVYRRTAPLTRYLDGTQFAVWRQLLSGQGYFKTSRRTSHQALRGRTARLHQSTPTETHFRPRSGTKTTIKRPPSTPPQRPELPQGNRRPSLKVPLSDRPLPRAPERHLSTNRDSISNHRDIWSSPGPKVEFKHEQPVSDVGTGLRARPLQEAAPKHFIETTDQSPAIGKEAHPEARTSSNTLSGEFPDLSAIQSARPVIDRSRLWDFKVAKALFESQIKGLNPKAAIARPKVISLPDQQAPDSRVQAPAAGLPPSSKISSSAREEPSTARQGASDSDSELAGLAGITATLQELQDTRVGPWIQRLLTSPQRTNSATLPPHLQEAIQVTVALKQSESPYSILKAELARIDGELRVVPLPHILPNMGELDREALLGVLNQAGANDESTEQADSGRWDPELVKQVRHEIATAGYLDEEADHIRKFNNADDGKAFLHFLSHLARKKLAHYGLSLIDMVNLVNETIGYGPFLKVKDINGTIRSMDPKRWGKDSEVLLHPLMGRANLVINVLDLIENNRISMEEVLDLLRIGTDGDIMQRLEVELEAAQIYRDDSELWKGLWKGQDAESLIPWFDDLLAQIRGAITDLKDVLAFVGSLETNPANDNSDLATLSA